MIRTCNKCGVTKPLSDFYAYRTPKSEGQYRTCKACVLERNRSYNAKNAPRQYNNQREWASRHPDMHANHWLKQKYGITLAEYNTLLEAQGGVCAICSQPETHLNARGNIQRLSVDHDHVTGAIRGLLCHSCNTGLGYFKNDPAIMEQAAKYMRQIIAKQPEHIQLKLFQYRGR